MVFHVEADQTRNLLTINFTGHVDAEEAKRCSEEVAARLPELNPGFRLLTDLTPLESMDPGCVPYIRRTMDACNQRGISLVVRVIPDPHKDIGFNILSIFHYRHGVRIVTVEKLEEAVKVLEPQAD